MPNSPIPLVKTSDHSVSCLSIMCLSRVVAPDDVLPAVDLQQFLQVPDQRQLALLFKKECRQHKEVER